MESVVLTQVRTNFKRFSYLLVLIFVMSVGSLHALQSSSDTRIFGTVIDKESGELLQDVNVYLSYTTSGIATESSGNYNFQTKLIGQFELVFSAVGYKSQRYLVSLGRNVREIELDVEMIRQSVHLDEIEVKADNSEWVQNYEIFEREFLGMTVNASNSVIENRWVLDFERNGSGELIASARDPIHITNQALGYKLTTDLNEFVWDTRNSSGYYHVKVWFEEIEPETDAQYQSWLRERRLVYRGSMRHFFKSLYDDELSRNRFQVVWADTRQRASIRELDEETIVQALQARNLNPELAAEGIKGFELREPVDVLIGRRSIRSDTRKRARIIPMTDDHYFFVTPDGNLADLMSISTSGHWSAMRMADMVPINYTP